MMIAHSGRKTVAHRLPPLYGRDRELAQLYGLLDGVQARGGALVVRGEAGIGKSALLARVTERAQGQGVALLTTTGVQSEMSLTFAGLHHLLQPFLSGLDRVPLPQRRALEAAFGVVEGETPDLFLVGLATLALVSEAAGDGPLLLVVEDAQWLDRPSFDVLAFLARRLEMEPILLLLAIRDEAPDALATTPLAELRLGRLEALAASALLDSHAPVLAAGLRARILTEAAGNPLALLELPDAVGREREPSSPDPLPLSRRLEETFAAKLPQLGTETRTLLLVAALHDRGQCHEVLAAAARLLGHPVTVEALSPALEAGLGVLDQDTVRFRHPLIRSAVHQAATAEDRQSAHLALADMLVGDLDRRAWHLAAAAAAPDEAVAAGLEAGAERARRRGGADVAVAALRRAADLSPDETQQARRLLAAAGLAFDLGQFGRAVSLLAEVKPSKLAATERGRFTLLSEFVDQQSFASTARWQTVIESAQRAGAEGDVDLALDLLWLLGSRAWWKDPGAEARRMLVTTAERIASINSDARVLSLLGYVAPFDRGRAVIARLSRFAVDADDDDEAARLLAAAAVVGGAWDVAPRFLAASLAGLRSQGRLAQLPRMLVMQAMIAAQLADWTTAMPAAQEARALALETGQPVWAGAADAAAALAAAYRGDDVLADQFAAAAERITFHLGASHVLALVQMARGAAALAAGRHPEAFEHLQRLFAPADPAHHWVMRWWALDNFVDAAVRTGNHAIVEPLVVELASLAKLTPAVWTQVVLAHARALLAPDRDAEALFHAALASAPERWPLQRGRLLLSYGQWLRRQRRIEQSRAPLRMAAEAFDACGAITWGTRARQELRASGETARRRVPDARDQLTPQELQIGRLAADGLSNREIGLQLYLSPRTVGTHLYRLFPKLGITSRAELRGALATAG